MFAYGIIIALATFILDQASKYWLLHGMHLLDRGVVELTPFLNIVVVWNSGVSFGMLSEVGMDNATALIVLAAGLSTWLLVWLSRVQHSFLARALGLVIGGAFGNIVDRIRFGAVFDFIDVHVQQYHWPAFNIADSAIVIGVCLIVLDGFLCKDSTNNIMR